VDISVDKTHWLVNGNELTVHQLFERQLKETPDAIAVYLGNKKLTYKELNLASELLSYSILALSPKSSIIGISTTRSVEMIVGVLAILKSGKAYLPLNPTYPKDRLQQIVTDSGIDCCLSSDIELPFYESLGTSVLSLDGKYNAAKKIKTETDTTLAYVLYTSGSTGKPKGVCMGHSPLVNLLRWQQKNSNAGPGTKTLQFAPLSFDVSFQEIFATLATGGTLVLIEDDLRLDDADDRNDFR